MERGGKRLTIDLHTQMVGEEAASSDSESDSESDDEGKRRMEPDEGGVLRLDGGSNDDDLDSVNGLFHWQIEDYELFPSCNMLTVDERDKTQENECPEECREAEEGKAAMAEAEGKNIQSEHRKTKDPTVWYMVNGPHRKKRMHRTKKLVEGYRQQGNNPNVRRPEAKWATKVTENKHKAWHDKPLKLNRFLPGQLVLKYDGQNEVKPNKFNARWVGPYQIRKVGDNGAIRLSTLDGQEVPPAVNRSKFKIYGARKTSSLSQKGTPSLLPNGDGRRQI